MCWITCHNQARMNAHAAILHMQVWNHLGLSNGSLLCALSIPRQLEGVSTGSSCGCAGPQRAGDNDDPSLRKVVIQGTKEQIARCDKFSFEKPNWMKVGECCSTKAYQERMLLFWSKFCFRFSRFFFSGVRRPSMVSWWVRNPRRGTSALWPKIQNPKLPNLLVTR